MKKDRIIYSDATRRGIVQLTHQMLKEGDPWYRITAHVRKNFPYKGGTDALKQMYQKYKRQYAGNKVITTISAHVGMGKTSIPQQLASTISFSDELSKALGPIIEKKADEKANKKVSDILAGMKDFLETKIQENQHAEA